MALEDLAVRGDLCRYDAELEPDEQPQRCVYFSQEFERWFEDTLPYERGRRGAQLTPFEEADQALVDFVLGRHMNYPESIRLLEPRGQGVWELKPVGVRIFGYFPRTSTFIAVAGAMKKTLLPHDGLRTHHLYRPYIDAVHNFAAKLDLDPPRFLKGKTTADVL